MERVRQYHGIGLIATSIEGVMQVFPITKSKSAGRRRREGFSPHDGSYGKGSAPSTAENWGR
jgi:hypothetical protein